MSQVASRKESESKWNSIGTMQRQRGTSIRLDKCWLVSRRSQSSHFLEDRGTASEGMATEARSGWNVGLQQDAGPHDRKTEPPQQIWTLGKRATWINHVRAFETEETPDRDFNERERNN
ncbi:uncharacterized protein LOC143913678 [Arctopsyche grandis]|uniref:uncharacterized protein LOC143913678 n=1 Tax=Arctopsyche grandis TaxID=121162 RepID=UPI00406D79E0